MAGVGKDSAMYETIHRQPADMRRVLADGWGGARAVGDRVSVARATHLVGIGTSYHAALFGAWVLREVGVDARAVSSFDFAHYPDQQDVRRDDVVIVLSHSGAKQFSLAALELAKARGAALFSVGGLEAEHPGSELVLRTTERERSAAFTSSHTTAMTVLAEVAVAAAERSGSTRAGALRSALLALPEQVEAMLAAEDTVRSLAEASHARQSYVVGAGPSEITALEAVIKAREAAYVRVDGMALEQFIHGPMICLQPDDVVVLISAGGAAAARDVEAAKLFDTLGAGVWNIGSDAAGERAIAVPATEESLSPILTTVAVQQWAWWMATLRDIDPDRFRTQEERFGTGIGAIQL